MGGRSPLESPLNNQRGISPLGGRGLGPLGGAPHAGRLGPVVASHDAVSPGLMQMQPVHQHEALGPMARPSSGDRHRPLSAPVDDEAARREEKKRRKREKKERRAQQALQEQLREEQPAAPEPDDWGFSEDFNSRLATGPQEGLDEFGFPVEAEGSGGAQQSATPPPEEEDEVTVISRKLYAVVGKSKPKHVRKYLRAQPPPDLSWRPSAVRDSLLTVAVTAGSTEVLGDLVAAGLDVNETSGLERVTGLMSAATANDADMVLALLRAGADWRAADANGETALDYARVHKATRVLDILEDPEAELPADCRFGCGAELRRKDLATHEPHCPQRVDECPRGCGAQLTAATRAEHPAVCPRRVVECENGCRITAGELADGHADRCPQREVRCREGCGHVVLLGERDAHERKERRAREAALQGLTSANARSWTPQQVSAWLGLLGMSEYQSAFVESAVDGQLLVDLRPADLASELGIVDSAHLEALSAAVAELREPQFDVDFSTWRWTTAATLAWLRQLCPRLADALDDGGVPLHGLLLLRGVTRRTCSALLPDASAAVRRSLRRACEEWGPDLDPDEGDLGDEVRLWSLRKVQQTVALALGDGATERLREALDARCAHGAVVARMTPAELRELAPDLKNLHVKRLQKELGLADQVEPSEDEDADADHSFVDDFEPDAVAAASSAASSPHRAPEAASAPTLTAATATELDAVNGDPEQTAAFLGGLLDWSQVVRSQTQTPAALLRRPPIRLVHSIVAAVCRNTGYGSAALSRRDLSYRHMEGRVEVQKEFFSRVIGIVACSVDRKLRARARSILTGRDGDATNEFLQTLAVAASRNPGGGGAGTPRKRESFASAQRLDGVIELTQWLAAANLELADAAGPLVRAGISSVNELRAAGPAVVDSLQLGPGLAEALRAALR